MRERGRPVVQRSVPVQGTTVAQTPRGRTVAIEGGAPRPRRRARVRPRRSTRGGLPEGRGGGLHRGGAASGTWCAPASASEWRWRSPATGRGACSTATTSRPRRTSASDAADQRLRGRATDAEQRDAAAAGGWSWTMMIRRVSRNSRRARRVAVAQPRGKMAGPTGFEPATSGLTGRAARSNSTHVSCYFC